MSYDDTPGEQGSTGTVFGREPTRPLPDADPQPDAEIDLTTGADVDTVETDLAAPDPETAGDADLADDDLADDDRDDETGFADDDLGDDDLAETDLDEESEAALAADLDHDRDPDTGAAAEAEPEPEAEPEAEPERAAVVAEAERDELSEQWDAAKVAFVDEPLRAVERAAALVTKALADLEQGWQSGGEPSTEDLRVAFQRYRAVFEAVRS
jgi:hypothetical protein